MNDLLDTLRRDAPNWTRCIEIFNIWVRSGIFPRNEHVVRVDVSLRSHLRGFTSSPKTHPLTAGVQSHKARAVKCLLIIGPP